MEEKKGFSETLSDFFAGKGFYIVLLLCAALIATSIWLMADGSRAGVEAEGEENNMTAAQAGQSGPEAHPGEVPVMRVDPPEPPERPRPTPTPAPAEAEEAVSPQSEPVPEAPAAAEQTAPVRETAAMPPVDYFIWPVNGALLRPHGVETLSYDATMADWRTHSGWDIAAPAGERVLCTANGVVSAVYRDGALGTVVEVEHAGGLKSVYANLSEDCPVSPGQEVAVGSVLGTVGATALYESGEVSHLHFAMRHNGEDADPAKWLPEP